MITDISGIILNPTNLGKNCLGNGEHYDKNGNLIPICCDECDLYILHRHKLQLQILHQPPLPYKKQYIKLLINNLF